MVDSYIHLSIIFPKAYEYRVSQKFVPLNSCTITFDQNFIFTWNCWKMFISLFSTCTQNFSYWHAHFFLFCFVFFITFWFCSRCCMNWDTACRPTDDPFWAFFISWCARASSTPKQCLFSLGSWKKYILGIHPKKIIIPASFHSKILYFSTNLRRAGRYLADWAEVFLTNLEASNFKHFKQLFMTFSGFGLLTNVRAFSLSLLFY